MFEFIRREHIVNFASKVGVHTTFSESEFLKAGRVGVQMGPAALCFGLVKWEDLFRIVLCFQMFTGVLHLKIRSIKKGPFLNLKEVGF